MVSEDQIRKVAAEFDKAIVEKNRDSVLSSFVDQCIIELPGVCLKGKEGVKKWIDWIYNHFISLKFTPITILVEGSTFFEEFILEGTFKNGEKIQLKQAEVLVYEDLKIRYLRLYFDRLSIAEAVIGDPLSKAVIRYINQKFSKEL